MRALLLLPICVLLAHGASAQPYLTNAQVFDYQPGDVFQSKGQAWAIWGPSFPPGIYTDTVLTREETNGGATRVYTMKHWAVAYQFYPQPPVATSSTDTLVVNDLDQPADHGPHDYCLQADSVGENSDQCGQLCWWRFNGADTCEMEETWRSWFYEGCGGPFFQEAFENGGNNFDLIYFHKGTVECGTFWDLPTAVGESDAPAAASIFPNPVTGTATVQGFDARGAVIVNLLGQRSGRIANGSQSDFRELPNGAYSLIGTDVHERPVRLPFLKQ